MPRLFDPAKFSKTLTVVGLRLPLKHVSPFMKIFKKHNALMKKVGVKAVVDDAECKSNSKADMTKIMLLDSNTVKDLELTSLPFEVRDMVSKTSGVQPVHYDLQLGTRSMSAEELLREVLPPSVTVPCSFETIGHICHLNLRDEHMPYKKLIGEIFLEKNANIQTVVTKVGTISTEFRVFEMELLAGKNEFETTVREHSCIFKFNFSEVYWNSRLQTEHQRMVDLLQKGDRVCDMTCGIGPFSIPAAKKGCIVHANDLNPKSWMYLNNNITINKLPSSLISTYNLDAREFVRFLKLEGVQYDHVILNLPALSIEFLDVFVGLHRDVSEEKNQSEISLPQIHCYCFSSAEEPEADVVARCEERMEMGRGALNKSAPVTVRKVRNVAPNKDMMYVSFPLPHAVAFAPKVANTCLPNSLTSSSPAAAASSSSSAQSANSTTQVTTGSGGNGLAAEAGGSNAGSRTQSAPDETSEDSKEEEQERVAGGGGGGGDAPPRKKHKTEGGG